MLKSKLVRPGWYAIPRESPRVVHNLREAGFECVFSFAYSYVKVTIENRLQYKSITGDREFLRVKDIEVDRLISTSLAYAAVDRYPGSKKEGTFTKNDILRTLSIQDNECICGKVITTCYTIDHIIPRSLGGSNNPENIQLLCSSCNSSKSDRSMEDWVVNKGFSFPKFKHRSDILRIERSGLSSLAAYKICHAWFDASFRKNRKTIPSEIISAVEFYMPYPVLDNNQDEDGRYVFLKWLDLRSGKSKLVRIDSTDEFWTDERKLDFRNTTLEKFISKFPEQFEVVEIEGNFEHIDDGTFEHPLPYLMARRAFFQSKVLG